MPKVSSQQQATAEKEMRNVEVIINSMTKKERKNPAIMRYSRKKREAMGSGITMQDINKVFKK